MSELRRISASLKSLAWSSRLRKSIHITQSPCTFVRKRMPYACQCTEEGALQISCHFRFHTVNCNVPTLSPMPLSSGTIVSRPMLGPSPGFSGVVNIELCPAGTRLAGTLDVYRAGRPIARQEMERKCVWRVRPLTGSPSVHRMTNRSLSISILHFVHTLM